MFLIFASLVNIGLDITFVKFLGLGVLGAALATLISQFLSGVLCMLFAIRTNPYFHLEKKDMRYDRKVVKDSLRLGIPLSLQFSMIAVSCMALQRVVNGFGDIAVTAFTATSRIEQVIHQPYQTLSAALSTYSGQNYGANKKDRVIEGYRKSLLIMAIFTLIMIPVLQFFGEDIVSLFLTDEPEVIRTGAIALRISSLFYLFLGVIYVARGVLSGIGDAFFALLNGIVEVIGRFTIPLFLTAIPMIGMWGIWWSVGIVWFVSGLTAWLRYVQKMRELTGKKLIPDRAAVR
jgi:Na+-driven multidrug efflux pump